MAINKLAKIPIVYEGKIYFYALKNTSESLDYLDLLSEKFNMPVTLKYNGDEEEVFIYASKLLEEEKYKNYKDVSIKKNDGDVYELIFIKPSYIVSVLKKLLRDEYIELENINNLLLEFREYKENNKPINELFTEYEKLLSYEELTLIIEKYFSLLEVIKFKSQNETTKEMEIHAYKNTNIILNRHEFESLEEKINGKLRK